MSIEEAESENTKFEEPATDLLEGLFAPSVEVRVSAIEYSLSDLPLREAECLRKAVVSRQREFATGRVIARRALESLGVTGHDLVRDQDRVPAWPTGVIGSISHTRGLCAVAVALSDEFQGVGLDVEPAEPVRPELETRICTERERDWLRELPSESERAISCRLVFSVKEAVYKAFFPQLREFWGFLQVETEIDFDSGVFVAQLPEGSGPASVTGRFARRQGWIMSGVQW